MLTYAMLGATYAVAAAAQPGQFQAYLIAMTMAHGWRRTIPVALAPIFSDLPVIALVLFVLTRVPPLFVSGLQLVGGVFLVYLAAGTLRAKTSQGGLAQAGGAVRQTVLKAALVNLLNPNPYIAWALILGPILIGAWRQAPSQGAAFLVAFYVTMVAATALIVVAFGAARAVGPRLARGLQVVSGVALAAFGVYQLWAGSRALWLVSG